MNYTYFHHIKLIMNNIDNKYWIWFSRIEKITSLQKQKLLEIYKTPKIIWQETEKNLNKLKFLDENSLKELKDKKYKKDIEKYEEYMIKNNIDMVTIQDKIYPEKLKKIYDSPIVLFTKGNLNLFNKKSIAMVGCRKCSDYGKNVAKKFAYDLVKNDFCIISGLAIGIDKFSHIGALEANGNTIAVVGNGLDNIYPFENQMLAQKIIENNGLIVTEYIIGTKPNRLNFPARNRIISGLSNGVLVVEAKKKSGALITADFAIEQGKDVFAVPGNIENSNSFGTNELIKQGAYLATNYKDVIDLIDIE